MARVSIKTAMQYRLLHNLSTSVLLLGCLVGQTLACIDSKQSQQNRHVAVTKKKHGQVDGSHQSQSLLEVTTAEDTSAVSVQFDALSDGSDSEEPVGMFFLGTLFFTPIAFMLIRRQRQRISVCSIL